MNESVGKTLPTVCILAGGMASRLGEMSKRTPKALIRVAGRPFIVHQLSMLAKHGVRRVVLCLGYLGEQIQEAIGREQFGIAIDYSFDEPGLSGTLGAIRIAAPLLGGEFLVMYGDTYLSVDVVRFADNWRRSGLRAGMTVIRNSDRWDHSNAIYQNGRVVSYDKRNPTHTMKWIDYGLGALKESALSMVSRTETDLSALYQQLAGSDELFGFEVEERFYEIGTPSALAETDRYLTTDGGRVTGKQ